MKILLLCLLLGIAASAFAEPAQVSRDDLSRTMSACGKPFKITSKPVTGLDGMSVKVLTYPGFTLRFARAAARPDLGYAFLIGYRGDSWTLDRSEMGKWLPCFEKVDAPTAAADVPTTVAPAVKGDSDPFDWVLLCGLCLVASPLFYVIWKARRWARRPSLLCLACKSVRQPGAYKNGRYFCPVCKADNPIPLDSPAARSLGVPRL